MTILRVSKRSMPFYPDSGIMIDLWAVLTQGDNNDYAAYAAIVPYSYIENDKNYENERREWVAKRGNKLSFKEALFHFPYLEEKEYRL